MKIYEIIDGESKQYVGCLLYFEKDKSFVIELQDYLDEWSAPLIFASTVKKGIYTINRELSHLWVGERVIPSGRQNIASILANAKMPIYDEMTLLEKSSAKCSQDKMYIRRIDEIPQFINERRGTNLVECVTCDAFSLLCFFKDKSAKKVNLNSIKGHPGIKKILSNEALYKSGHIAAGGYCFTFNDSIDIDSKVLYENGEDIPLSLNDFLSFVSANIVDTSECCDILGCSRQNLSNYVGKKLLVPIKRDMKGNLYTKGNIYLID